MNSLKCADITKLAMDYFYRDPEMVAKAFMATGEVSILQECKKRNINIAPYLQAEIERHGAMMGLMR